MENHNELAGHQCPILVEHIVEILSRLPVKSLMRFKCVSQSWRSLISSTEFIALHTNKVLDDKEFFFRSRRVLFNRHIDDTAVDPGRVGPYSIDLDQFLQNHNADDNTTCACGITPTELEFIRDNIDPTPRDRRLFMYFSNICFCINLVLFKTCQIPGYYLVNPATREMKKLPKTTSVTTSEIYGLGFDHVSNDYKVIDVDVTKYRDGRRYAVYNVYSTKTNSWREIECHSRYVPCDCQTGIFFNGDIHLIGYNAADEKCGIVSFVVAEERLYEIEPPTGTSWGSHEELGVFRDCLSITFKSWSCQEFWVMKDYKVSESWTKMRVFSYSSSLSHIGFSTKTHNVIVYENSLCVYECDKKLQRLQVHDILKIGDLVGVYVEGLFPLTDGSNSVSQTYTELQAEHEEFLKEYYKEEY